MSEEIISPTSTSRSFTYACGAGGHCFRKLGCELDPDCEPAELKGIELEKW